MSRERHLLISDAGMLGSGCLLLPFFACHIFLPVANLDQGSGVNILSSVFIPSFTSSRFPSLHTAKGTVPIKISYILSSDLRKWLKIFSFPSPATPFFSKFPEMPRSLLTLLDSKLILISNWSIFKSLSSCLWSSLIQLSRHKLLAKCTQTSDVTLHPNQVVINVKTSVWAQTSSASSLDLFINDKSHCPVSSSFLHKQTHMIPNKRSEIQKPKPKPEKDFISNNPKTFPYTASFSVQNFHRSIARQITQESCSQNVKILT